jgi:putative sigma-54 modulation protein
MSIQVAFKNIDHTPALDQNIQERTEKIKAMFPESVSVNWLCWVEAKRHYSEVIISGIPGPQIKARAGSDNLYKTFDAVVKKVETQLRKKIEKRQDRQAEPLGWL